MLVLYVHACAQMYVHVKIFLCVSIYLHGCERICMCISALCECIGRSKHVILYERIGIYEHTCVFVCTRGSVRTCARLLISMNTCTFVQIFYADMKLIVLCVL